MLRYRMNKLLKLLETNDFNDVRDEVLSPENRRAIDALIDAGCIEATTAWGGDIVNIRLLRHHVGYQLSRQEIWLNRFYGFLAGVATSVVAHYIIVLIG